MKIQRYKKEFDYSYSLGFYPTIELLQKKPQEVLEVIYSVDAIKSNAFETIRELCDKKNIELTQNDKTIERLALRDNTYIIGVFKKYSSNLVEGEDSILLYRISDLGNLGTISRSSIGFDVKNLGIISPGVDIFNPQVVRASMGAIFSINFEYFESISEYKNKFNSNLYLFDIKGKELLNSVKFEKPSTFVFGSEGDGLEDSDLNLGKVVRIEQSDKIDSLNLANSVSIVLHKNYVK